MKPGPCPSIRTFFFAVLLLFFPKLSLSQLSQSQLKLTSDQQSQIQDLATRLLKHADSAGCKKTCSILVANFTGETGQTSPLGVQLADEVSEQLAGQAKGLQIVSRHNLQQYLERERIPSKLLEDDNAARWLATENGANVVLIGYLKVGLTEVTLRAQLLDTKDFARRNAAVKTRVEEAVFHDIANLGDVEPAEPFGPMPAFVLNGEKIEKLEVVDLGEKFKMTPPHCAYHPDPPYTETARQAKAQGNIVLQVALSKDGQILDVRPITGAPYGLNRTSVDTVRTWKCSPAIQNGAPITGLLPVEVTFRLF